MLRNQCDNVILANGSTNTQSDKIIKEDIFPVKS